MIVAPPAFTALPIVPMSSNGIVPGLPLDGFPGLPGAQTGDMDFMTLMFQMLAAAKTPAAPTNEKKKDGDSIIDACAVVPGMPMPGMPALPMPVESVNPANPANAISNPNAAHITSPTAPAIAVASQMKEPLAPLATSPSTPTSTSVNPAKEPVLATPQTPVARTQADTPAPTPKVPSQPTVTDNAQATVPNAPATLNAPVDQPKTPVQEIAPVPEQKDVHRAEAPMAPAGRDETRPAETLAPIHAQAPIVTETPVSKPITAVATSNAPALAVQAAPKPDTDDADVTAVDDDAVGMAEAVHQTEPADTDKHARVEEARPSAPLSDQVHEHASAHLDQLREMGHVEVQMNLHPPELGQVKMHLALDDGNLSVRFTVQNDGARTALTQQMEPMRVRFAEMGLSLGNFDVRRDNDSSNWQQAQDSEGAGQTGQTQRAVMRVAQKGYAPVTDPSALVDVIA